MSHIQLVCCSCTEDFSNCRQDTKSIYDCLKKLMLCDYLLFFVWVLEYILSFCGHKQTIAQLVICTHLSSSCSPPSCDYDVPPPLFFPSSLLLHPPHSYPPHFSLFYCSLPLLLLPPLSYLIFPSPTAPSPHLPTLPSPTSSSPLLPTLPLLLHPSPSASPASPPLPPHSLSFSQAPE